MSLVHSLSFSLSLVPGLIGCLQLNRYQEQAYLLDPHLHDIIDRLSDSLLQHSTCINVHHEGRILELLYQIANVRGHRVLRMYANPPHLLQLAFRDANLPAVPVKCLPVSVDWLRWLTARIENTSQALSWQSAYIVLLWLSIAILVPFDLESFDADQQGVCCSCAGDSGCHHQ
jgi:tubulin-specific chaperone D